MLQCLDHEVLIGRQDNGGACNDRLKDGAFDLFSGADTKRAPLKARAWTRRWSSSSVNCPGPGMDRREGEPEPHLLVRLPPALQR